MRHVLRFALLILELWAIYHWLEALLRWLTEAPAASDRRSFPRPLPDREDWKGPW